MEKETKNTLTKWIMLVLLSALVCLLMFELGSINETAKHLKDPTIVTDSVIVKDQTETKKLRAVVDSVVKENKRLDQIIKRKKSNTSQILINNAINKEKVLSASDSTVIFLLDSLLSKGFTITNQPWKDYNDYREYQLEHKGRSRHLSKYND
jgi:hypothetical protein